MGMRKNKVMNKVFALAITFCLVLGFVAGSMNNVQLEAADYSTAGCVSWVKDRAAKLGITLPSTGYNKYGLAGASAYWSKLPGYGYSVGSEPAANALAVWEFSSSSAYKNYGHVAFVESVNGDNVTLTEGGLPAKYTYGGHTGARQVTVSKGSVSSLGGCSGFYGYIYLTGAPQVPVTQTPSIQVCTNQSEMNAVGSDVVSWQTKTNWGIFAYINNPNSGTIGNVGVVLYDAVGNEISKKEETYAPSGNKATKGYMYYNINSELGVTLNPGTKYLYCMYAYIDGTMYKSDLMSFTTNQPDVVATPTPAKTAEPTPTPYQHETQECDSFIRADGDGIITVGLTGAKQGTDLKNFSYAISFDETKLKPVYNVYKNGEKELSGYGGYSFRAANVCTVVVSIDNRGYYVLGGIANGDEDLRKFYEDEPIFAMQFKVLDGKNTGNIAIVRDSQEIIKKLPESASAEERRLAIENDSEAKLYTEKYIQQLISDKAISDSNSTKIGNPSVQICNTVNEMPREGAFLMKHRTDTNWEICAYINNPKEEQISNIGVVLYDSTGYMIGKKENEYYDVSILDKPFIFYNVNDGLGVELTENTSYSYKVYAVVGNEKIESDMIQFTTLDEDSAANPSWTAIPTTSPISGTDTSINPTKTPLSNEKFILGDADLDKDVDLEDVSIVLKAALGITNITDEQKKAGDYNCDNLIDLTDVLLILRKALGIEV